MIFAYSQCSTYIRMILIIWEAQEYSRNIVDDKCSTRSNTYWIFHKFRRKTTKSLQTTIGHHANLNMSKKKKNKTADFGKKRYHAVNFLKDFSGQKLCGCYNFTIKKRLSKVKTTIWLRETTFNSNMKF